MNNYSHKLPQAIVISCIDFRFHDKLKDELKKEKINSFDLLALAGGAKNLANPSKSSYKEAVINNIKLAQNLHKIKKIILCNHMDCGAYGGSGKFKDKEKETKFHKTELKKAGNLAKKLFPALKVQTILLVSKTIDK